MSLAAPQFLFDFGSPNAFLSHEAIPAIEARIGVKFEYVPVLLGGIASIGLSSIAVANSLTGLGTLFVGNHRKSELTRPLVVAALRALLKRQGSRTIVQNPDDKRFVLGLGVPEASVELIPGSGVDTQHFVPLLEPPPPVTAAYVGRMLADKGVITLIQA